MSTPYDEDRPEPTAEHAHPDQDDRAEQAPRPYDEPLDPPLRAEPRPVEDVADDVPVDMPVEVEPVEAAADSRVAAAVARLDALGDAPPAEHVEVYEDVHRVLQDALADAARGDQQQ